jgi:GNAT superfamily N-acetyltransferase
MSAVDHLSDLQFKFTPAKPARALADLRDGVPVTDSRHRLNAVSPDGKSVGSIEWHPWSGRVEDINVDRNYRRQGVATQLWNEAQSTAQRTRGVNPPKHSDIQFPDGKAWVAGMARKEFQQRQARLQPRTREARAVASEDQAALF